jgi:putative endonuclease
MITQETGKKGENLAVDFLLKNGYEILEQNWRHKQYEIDIIARKASVLVIAEVKTRTGNFFGEPEEWVTTVKQNNLIKGAQAYIQQQDLDVEVRFDIISIVLSPKGAPPKIHHIEDAFYPLV